MPCLISINYIHDKNGTYSPVRTKYILLVRRNHDDQPITRADAPRSLVDKPRGLHHQPTHSRSPTQAQLNQYQQCDASQCKQQAYSCRVRNARRERTSSTVKGPGNTKLPYSCVKSEGIISLDVVTDSMRGPIFSMRSPLPHLCP